MNNITLTSNTESENFIDDFQLLSRVKIDRNYLVLGTRLPPLTSHPVAILDDITSGPPFGMTSFPLGHFG